MSAAARRVLIADDDPVASGLLRNVLQNIGMTVIGEVVDGKQAYADCQRLKPEVVCLDIEMPEMKGTEVLSRLRRELPGSLIFLITSFATAQNVRSAMQMGADGIITKPVNKDTVATEIRRASAKRKLHAY